MRVEGGKGAVWTVDEREYQRRKGSKYHRYFTITTAVLRSTTGVFRSTTGAFWKYYRCVNELLLFFGFGSRYYRCVLKVLQVCFFLLLFQVCLSTAGVFSSLSHPGVLKYYRCV